MCTQDVCYKLDGSAHDLPQSYVDYKARHRSNPCCGEVFVGEETSLTKVFFPLPGDVMDCFDVATGLQCPNFPVGPIGRAYSAGIDPLNSNCLWTNGDQGIIKTCDIPMDPEIKAVQIEGHTDSSGGVNHNRELSKQRAQSVRKRLIEHGIDPLRLTAAGFGPDRPIDSNSTEEGRRNNRRVELRIAAPPAIPATP